MREDDLEDLLDELGPPDRIDPPADDRLRSRTWRCGSCGHVVESVAPVTAPAPCPVCGGVFFVVVRPAG